MSPQASQSDSPESLQQEEKTLFARAVAYFKNNNWRSTQIEDQPILQIPFQGENGEWMCYAQVSEELGQFRFYSVAPMRIPEQQRLTVAEFITRINYGMGMGNFELDFSDGELRYRTSTEVEDGDLPDTIMARLVYVNVLAMDEYLPTIMSISYGQVSPLEAIKNLVEKTNPQEEEEKEGRSPSKNKMG